MLKSVSTLISRLLPFTANNLWVLLLILGTNLTGKAFKNHRREIKLCRYPIDTSKTSARLCLESNPQIYFQGGERLLPLLTVYIYWFLKGSHPLTARRRIRQWRLENY